MVIYLICAIISFLLGLFVKDYLPSYFNKNGENLATKEDIAEITALQEKVQDELHKEFERFSSDVHFKYDFIISSILICIRNSIQLYANQNI